jgi:hypothetical protein
MLKRTFAVLFTLALALTLGVVVPGASQAASTDPLTLLAKKSAGTCGQYATNEYLCGKHVATSSATSSTSAAVSAQVPVSASIVTGSSCGASSKWGQQRFQGCQNGYVTQWQHWQYNTNGTVTLLGTINTESRQLYSTKKGSTNITHKYEIWRSSAGTGTYNQTSLRVETTDKICTVTNGSVGYLTWNGYITGNHTVSCNVAAGKKVTAALALSYVVLPGSSAGDKVIPEKLSHPAIRCDRVTYVGSRAGCVLTAVQPTFKMSTKDAATKHTAAHVKAAQKSLKDHWGNHALGGKVLTRKYWGAGKSTNNPNRKVACKGFVKKNSTDSCDEYPFASTHQGAYYVGKSRVSVAHVPSADNSKAGSKLATFFSTYRILDTDAFWVSVS